MDDGIPGRCRIYDNLTTTTSSTATSQKMREVIVLDDDEDNVVPMASMEKTPSPVQQQSGGRGLTEEQRQRMAHQKELALARRLAKEKLHSSRLVGGLQSALTSQPQPRILDSSEFPTAVVDHHYSSGWRSTRRELGSGGGGQVGHGFVSSPYFRGTAVGEVASGAGRGFKRIYEDEAKFIDLSTTDDDQYGWRSVRKRPVPGQSFGRDINAKYCARVEGVVHGETSSSSTHHGLAEDNWKREQSREDEERTPAGGTLMNSLPPTPTDGPEQDSQQPVPQTKIGPKPSKQQMQVLNAIRNGKSVFLTGSAGTGKSYVLEYAIKLLRVVHSGGGVYVTASTGLAACALGGTTLHSFAGVGLGTAGKEKLVGMAKGKREIKNRWKYAKALIIDEISMIDGEFFDKLDYVGRTIREKSQPFGGIQLVVTGDFFQLPPVNPQNPNKFFAFQADCWDKCFDLQIELNTVFRQSDQEFVGMLNEIRRGQCSPSALQRLQNCFGPVGDDSGVSLTRLYPRKMDVGRENEQNLRALGQPTVIFKAWDNAKNEFAKRQLENMRAEAVISLSLGAQVMLAKNLDTTAGLVNGARGIVVGFTLPGDRRSLQLDASAKLVNPSGMWPLVKFASDSLVRMIGPESWDIMEGDKEVARRTQVPLSLAWALSVHKCQGMTLDRVETDLSRAFDCGMVYVALSRVKSLDGLRLIGFDPSKIRIHGKVALFYDKLKQLKQANDTDESTCYSTCTD